MSYPALGASFGQLKWGQMYWAGNEASAPMIAPTILASLGVAQVDWYQTQIIPG